MPVWPSRLSGGGGLRNRGARVQPGADRESPQGTRPHGRSPSLPRFQPCKELAFRLLIPKYNVDTCRQCPTASIGRTYVWHRGPGPRAREFSRVTVWRWHAPPAPRPLVGQGERLLHVGDFLSLLCRTRDSRPVRRRERHVPNGSQVHQESLYHGDSTSRLVKGGRRCCRATVGSRETPLLWAGRTPRSWWPGADRGGHAPPSSCFFAVESVLRCY